MGGRILELNPQTSHIPRVTANRCGTKQTQGQDSYLLESSLPRNFHHFVIIFYTSLKGFYINLYLYMSFLLVPLLTLMVMALCLASSLSTLSLVPQAYSMGSHLISIDSCLLCHKVPFDKGN